MRFLARTGLYGQKAMSPGKGAAAMREPKTYTLEVPGAVLHYDVRENGGVGNPVLLLVGAPMGASGFAALAEQFADRTVVTYYPGGRSAASAPTASRQGLSPASTLRICAGSSRTASLKIALATMWAPRTCWRPGPCSASPRPGS
jgi:hypothetical protein